MADRPDSYFTMFVGDYLRDTMHLNTRQHGAYQLLLMHYYGTGRPLPLEDETLRTIARELPTDWKTDRPIVMAFFTKQADGWHQTRADKELASANVRYERAVKGAKAKHAGKQRSSTSQAGVEHNTEHVLDGCLNDANPNPNPPPTEKPPSGVSSDRRPRAAAHGKAAAPPAGPGWEASHQKWAEYRAKIGEGAWRSWFADASVNGSETSLLIPSEFAVEQVRFRYGKDLDEHFGTHVSIRFAGAA